MPNRPRRGFIIIFGWRYVRTRERQAPVTMCCPSCGEQAQIVGKVGRTWATLFFIPVLPLQTHGDRLTQCTRCQATFNLTIEQMRRKAEGSGPNTWQASIELHNQLRESPADSDLLLKLLQVYHDMDEPREILGAARQFSQALQNCPRCMTLVAEAHHRCNDAATARTWLTAALQKDPAYPQALALQRQLG